MESLSDIISTTQPRGIYTHTDVSPQCVCGFVFVCFFLFFKPGGEQPTKALGPRKELLASSSELVELKLV